MFGEQATQWFPHGIPESNFGLAPSQGQSDNKILHDRYPYQSEPNPSSYPPDIIAPGLGSFGMFQPSAYPQQQLQNFSSDKQTPEQSIEPLSVSPKSLSFYGPQMTGPLTPTVCRAPHFSQLIDSEIPKNSFGLMGYCSPNPTTKCEQIESANLEYQNAIGYQINNENVGHRKEQINYVFSQNFQSDFGSNMTAVNPPATVGSSQLDQLGLLGPDINNFLDSFFKDPGSMPIDPTRETSVPGLKLPNVNSADEVGLNSPKRNHIGVNTYQRSDKDYQTGVLKPLQNITQQASDKVLVPLQNVAYEKEAKPVYKEHSTYLHSGTPEILELPRIARNPPKHFSGGSGTGQVQKRKLSVEEADQRFISCRTIKTTRRVVTGGKNSRGTSTYCPLITVSIPSVPWIPEVNSGPKTNSKNSSFRRSKLGQALRKKAKIEKH
ncbi:hypothetical protein PGT21_022197 [Puccinia graminis f. sp. tritici]|uniref:Uncharacterized protein n=1 Tax=Puccinia graminis f. sp. tritici TaxID=56615 RepID=A0A5B0NZ29_PUCGR|nr:hypothetical protein PGT21_022197 [Puccinia graminis f. sp. tritici]KAA1129127.1 hypothetical protein PGTUg99_030708 [Puccinia graminis f. sp. tritici]